MLTRSAAPPIKAPIAIPAVGMPPASAEVEVPWTKPVAVLVAASVVEPAEAVLLTLEMVVTGVVVVLE